MNEKFQRLSKRTEREALDHQDLMKNWTLETEADLVFKQVTCSLEDQNTNESSEKEFDLQYKFFFYLCDTSVLV